MDPKLWKRRRVSPKPPPNVYDTRAKALLAAATAGPGKMVAVGWGGYYLKDATPTRIDPPKGGLYESFLRSGQKK